jgi:hypothetical protein
MKRLSTILLLAIAAPAIAHYDDNQVIYEASTPVTWCRAEVEMRYRVQNITPYQWTTSHHDYAGTLYVDGKLRVHGDDVVVRCRMLSGARTATATVEIDDP